MRNRALSKWLAPLVTGLVVASTSPAAAVTFRGLGDLPGGSLYSVATGVSADGSTVTGYSSVGTTPGFFTYEAFHWTASEGMVGLGDLPGGPPYSIATGISGDGSVITGYSESGGGYGSGIDEAFRWTASTGMVPLSGVPGFSQASGISDDGSTIVGGVPSGYRWTAGVVTPLAPPAGFDGTLGEATSADGSVVVGVAFEPNATGVGRAARWNADGSAQSLGDLPGGANFSWANDVSADGSVVVGTANITPDSGNAFRWTASTGMVDLGTLPGFPVNPTSSGASGVSADGSIIIGSASSRTGNKAFIWTETFGMVQLDNLLKLSGVDLADWSLWSATGISADGLTIVGTGTHVLGTRTEAWIVVIPEPSTGVLVMTGLLALAYRHRRHGREASAA